MLMAFKKGHKTWNKGKKYGEETKKKITAALIEQYKNGTRNPKTAAKKAQEVLRTKGHYKRDNTYLLGENNPSWKGGRNITKNGYVRIRKFGAYVLEHQYVWEMHNGPISKGHDIHHKNGNKQDNRIENLECMSNAGHQKLHNDKRERQSNGRWGS